MTICRLDATHDSMDAIYNALQLQLDLPAHFGRNLDALWDALSLDVPGPIEIVWKDHNWVRGKLDADYDKLITVLRDTERARPDFKLTLA